MSNFKTLEGRIYIFKELGYTIEELFAKNIRTVFYLNKKWSIVNITIHILLDTNVPDPCQVDLREIVSRKNKQTRKGLKDD